MSEKKKPNYKRGAPPRMPTKLGGKAIAPSRQFTMLTNSPIHQGRQTKTLVKLTKDLGEVTSPAGIPFRVALPCEHIAINTEEEGWVCRFACDEWKEANGRAAA